jgi:superfamily II DNA or RNA helicase
LGGLLELPCAWGKTSASLYICSQLRKKTLVIVHKEFLLNQWIERIQQFIPEAKIGRIQGQIIDVQDKDIVLCMLQSLVLKDYDQSIFDDFGFTIIDEVHHISSETFSNALFKIVTKYMLGLSATMNRKDGTTKVFKMFLGEVVHKVERKGEHNVEIRAVTYKSDDSEFNETILDYKGQPQISSMISKLCAYEPRTDFILKLLTDFIKVDGAEITTHNIPKPACALCKSSRYYLVKNTCCNTVKYCLTCMNNVVKNVEAKKRPKCPCCTKVLKFEQNYIENPWVKPMEQRQTIVLSHNLNILEYMYNKIINENLASVGYYIGGMHEEDMKKSEKKQVILATYAVANEGLDIPSLNAEFLITPKTDVVQTIGRVLRAKHAYADPVIYDIVDSHDVFQKQWAKRKSYYAKNNYSIIGCNSNNYNPCTNGWKKIHSPGAKEEKEEDELVPSGKCLIQYDESLI